MGRNKPTAELKVANIVGKKVLILGESGSGKTKLAATLLKELADLTGPEKITIIDLAPKRIGNVGGKLRDYAKLAEGVRTLSPAKVYTPRLAGTSPDEISRFARLNREAMEPLLYSYMRSPTEVLVLNDVTLYLHSGRLETVLKCIKLSKTFLATAYYGSKLAQDLGTGISSRERQLTDRLAASMDLVVKIS